MQDLIERVTITADANMLIDVQQLFSNGETLTADVMTLRLQGYTAT